MSFFRTFMLPFILLVTVCGLFLTGALPHTDSPAQSVEIVRRGTPLFSEPSYDSHAESTLTAGSYSLLDEVCDAEGNRWGKVGDGWIDLTALDRANLDPPPITAWYAESGRLGGTEYESYADGPADILTVALAFYPSKDLSDVRFYILDYDLEGAEVWNELYAFDSLSADSAFLASVKFYGDQTLYGISCNDGGVVRRFAVSISGRNNSLLLTER